MSLENRLSAAMTRIASEFNILRAEIGSGAGFTLTETSPGSGLYQMSAGGTDGLVETSPGSGLYQLVV